MNLAAERSGPIITERWWGSHNHKDSNRNLNQQMIPDWLVASVYTGPSWFTLPTGNPIVPQADLSVSPTEPWRRSTYEPMILVFFFPVLLSLTSHINGVFLLLLLLLLFEVFTSRSNRQFDHRKSRLTSMGFALNHTAAFTCPQSMPTLCFCRFTHTQSQHFHSCSWDGGNR